MEEEDSREKAHHGEMAKANHAQGAPSEEGHEQADLAVQGGQEGELRLQGQAGCKGLKIGWPAIERSCQNTEFVRCPLH